MTKFTMMYLCIPVFLATMSGSGCKRYYGYKPRWNTAPSSVTWQSLLSDGKPIVLNMGNENYLLHEAHMEGETLVAMMGEKLPADSITEHVHPKRVGVPKDSIPTLPDWANTAYVYADGITSMKGGEVRMDQLKISSVKTYVLEKEANFWEVFFGIIFLLVLMAWKLLPLFL